MFFTKVDYLRTLLILEIGCGASRVGQLHDESHTQINGLALITKLFHFSVEYWPLHIMAFIQWVCLLSNNHIGGIKARTHDHGIKP